MIGLHFTSNSFVRVCLVSFKFTKIEHCLGGFEFESKVSNVIILNRVAKSLLIKLG